MENKTINVRVDSKTKKEAQELFEKLGLNISTAINLFLNKAIDEQGIPFEIKLSKPNKQTIKAFKEVDKMVENKTGKNFDSVDDFFEDLNK